MRAYALPYKIFEDNSDFVNQLFALLEYTKKRHNDNINVETNLFFKVVIQCLKMKLNLLEKNISTI